MMCCISECFSLQFFGVAANRDKIESSSLFDVSSDFFLGRLAPLLAAAAFGALSHWIVGEAVGRCVGEFVGNRVGCFVGTAVGFDDGDGVGSQVGFADGALVGR